MNPPSAGLDPPGRRSRATPTRISRVPRSGHMAAAMGCGGSAIAPLLTRWPAATASPGLPPTATSMRSSSCWQSRPRPAPNAGTGQGRGIFAHDSGREDHFMRSVQGAGSQRPGRSHRPVAFRHCTRPRRKHPGSHRHQGGHDESVHREGDRIPARAAAYPAGNGQWRRLASHRPGRISPRSRGGDHPDRRSWAEQVKEVARSASKPKGRLRRRRPCQHGPVDPSRDRNPRPRRTPRQGR